MRIFLTVLLTASAALPAVAEDADEARRAEAAKAIGRAWELRGKTEEASMKESREAVAKACAAIRELYPRLANPMQVAYRFPKTATAETRAMALEMMEKRLNAWGVENPRIVSHNGAVVFLLLNETDEKALSDEESETLGWPGPIEFHLEADLDEQKEWKETGIEPKGTRLYPAKDGGIEFLAKSEPSLDSTSVASASVGEEDGRPQIRMTLTEKGAAAMEKLTTANLGKQLAIVFGRKVLMAPVIQSKLSKNLVVTGNFKKGELRKIVAPLNVDRLPCRLEPAGTSARVEIKPGEDLWAAEPAETFADRLVGSPLVHAILEDVLRERDPVAYREILEARKVKEKTR